MDKYQYQETGFFAFLFSPYGRVAKSTYHFYFLMFILSAIIYLVIYTAFISRFDQERLGLYIFILTYSYSYFFVTLKRRNDYATHRRTSIWDTYAEHSADGVGLQGIHFVLEPFEILGLMNENDYGLPPKPFFLIWKEFIEKPYWKR